MSGEADIGSAYAGEMAVELKSDDRGDSVAEGPPGADDMLVTGEIERASEVDCFVG